MRRYSSRFEFWIQDYRYVVLVLAVSFLFRYNREYVFVNLRMKICRLLVSCSITENENFQKAHCTSRHRDMRFSFNTLTHSIIHIFSMHTLRPAVDSVFSVCVSMYIKCDMSTKLGWRGKKEIRDAKTFLLDRKCHPDASKSKRVNSRSPFLYFAPGLIPHSDTMKDRQWSFVRTASWSTLTLVEVFNAKPFGFGL